VANNGGFDRKLTREYINVYKNEKQKLDIVSNMFVSLNTEQADVQLVRIMPFKEVEYSSVVRMIANDGSMEYYFLKVNDDAKIADIFQISRGTWLSNTVGQMTSLMLGNTEGLLKQLTRTLNSQKSALESYQPLIDAYIKGDYATAYKVFLSLPDDLRNVQQVQEMAVLTATHLGDDIYASALTSLNETHGDNPDLSFMLMDLHALNGDYNSVINSLTMAMELTGPDAHLLDLRGVYYSLVNNYDAAYQDYKAAIIAEPNYMESYWSLVDYHNAQADYQALAQVLQTIIQRFDWQISAQDLKEAEGFEQFVQSQAFKVLFPADSE
jgi:tetratricopeptide (TPR) repeat protein